MEYYQPESLSQAGDLLASADNPKLVAGGQSMMPLLRQGLTNPDALVDISGVTEAGINEIQVDHEARELRVGALVSYTELLEHPIAAERPLLRETLEAIGDVQVRNAGTLGGGIAHADPAQDLPPALLCYGTEVIAVGPDGETRYDLDSFFIDFYFTELAPEEIIRELVITLPPSGSGGAFKKHARTPGGFSEAAVGALVVPDENGEVADARLAYCAGGPVPSRVDRSIEEAFAGGTPTEADKEAAATALVDEIEILEDAGETDVAYIEHLFGVLTERAIASAIDRADGLEVRG